MSLSFPSNPVVGQTSATQSGRVYRFNGTAWEFTAISLTDAARWNLFAPPAPTNLAAVASNAQVSLSWVAPAGVLAQAPITDYIVQYSSNGGSTWTTFSDGTSTTTSATVTGLTNGTAYVFRVAAVNGVGTGPYTAATSSVTPSASVSVDYLVVAGGGQGSVYESGGGGAGGYLAATAQIAPGTTYTVTVGGGGTGGDAYGSRNGSSHSGSNSSLGSLATAIGGGGGAGGYGAAGSGGSGGGANPYGELNGSPWYTGGGNTAGQGNAGGNAYYQRAAGGGGGGASTSGGNGTSATPTATEARGGAGGNGMQWLDGNYYAGGGGGAASNYLSIQAAGGQGGGGAGGCYDSNGFRIFPTGGEQNTGGGAGGMVDDRWVNNGFSNLAYGGSGIVIIRAATTAASITGSPAVTTSGGYTFYKFTGSGSITF